MMNRHRSLALLLGILPIALGLVLAGTLPLSSVGASPSFQAELTNRVYLPIVFKQGAVPDVPGAPTPIPPGAPTPTPPSSLALDGTWSGTTSQGNPLSFTVANNGIASISVGFSIPACGVSGTHTTTFTPPRPITGNTFSVTVTGTGSSALSYTLTGTFGSSTAASGNVAFSFRSSFPNPSCTGTANATWSATKQ